MPSFKPFQFLYQTFKDSNQKLFQTFETIHNDLQELYDMADNLIIQKSGINVLDLKSFFQDVEGLSLTLRKPGKWLISVNLEVTQVSPDVLTEFVLVGNGITQERSGKIYNDSGTITLSSSKVWLFDAIMKPPNTVSIKVRAKGGVNSSVNGLNSEIVATWMTAD